jgi:hypothetical protein
MSRIDSDTKLDDSQDFGFDLIAYKRAFESGAHEYRLGRDYLSAALEKETSPAYVFDGMRISEIVEVNNFEEGMEEMINSAYKGNVDANNWLANACLNLVIPKEFERRENSNNYYQYVFEYCNENREDEYLAAMANLLLGVLYLTGKGVQQNDKQAFDYFEIALKGPFLNNDGHCNSDENLSIDLVKLYLSVLYQQGKGCERSSDKALNYYPDDTKFLGMLLVEGAVMQCDYYFQVPRKFFVNCKLGLLFKFKEFDLAEHLCLEADKYSYGANKDDKDTRLDLVDKSRKLEEKNKLLIEAQRELEETMSMFAHKFRSPLDAIIYNTNHEHQPKLYIQAAQTMRGLLDIFSIISADDVVLIERLKGDNQGDSGLLTVFSKTLDMILLHLLSAQAAEKIQQHYLRYAKKQGLCDAELSYKQWNDDYFELERQLQMEWEQSFAELLSQQATLEQRLAWLEERFFKLELQGFEQANIQFKEYGITESFLTILLNEILVNSFKYYSSDTQQPVVLAWAEGDSYQVLSCRNPSARNERERFKGSGKGHTFLSALARKTSSQFTKPKPQDDFVLEFGIANQLLLSN